MFFSVCTRQHTEHSIFFERQQYLNGKRRFIRIHFCFSKLILFLGLFGNKRMILIGLIGYKQSGKDTFADYLVTHYGFKKHAFAQPVKQICQIMFHLNPDQLHDPHQKEVMDPRWQLSPRQMMQKVGTDMVRTMMGDDFWVRHMNTKLSSEEGRVIVSDVRFQNEAELIRHRNGILIRIVSEEQSLDTHPSEMEQLLIQEDICIKNHKTGLPQFHQKIDNLLPHLLSCV